MTHFMKLTKPSLWRRLARAGWSAPSDPSIHGCVDVDMTNALKFIEDVRKATGERVTITHLVTKAIAMALREYPMLNGVIRWDGFYLRKTIDIFVLAARDHGDINRGGGLSGVKVPQADHMTIVEIAQHLQKKVPDVVHHRDPELGRTEKTLSYIPDLLLKPVLGVLDALTYELDIDLRKFGVPYDQFGSCVITNVGMLGLPNGFAPIFPPSHCPMVLSVGEVRTEPMVVGNKVLPRPRMVVGAVVDHRFIDGLGVAKMARRFRELLDDPAKHLAAELGLNKPAKKKPVAPVKVPRSVVKTPRANGDHPPEQPTAAK
jgi:hypothetical protein